jgi:DNA-binding IclR family transcriptional regulator
MSSPALEKGLDILTLLNCYPDGLRFTQITDSLDIPRSSAVRILKSLEEKGFVEQSGERGKYRLSKASFSLGQATDYAERISQLAEKDMADYLKAHNKTIVLFYNMKDHTRCIAKANSEYTIQMQNIGEERYDLLMHPWGIIFYSELSSEAQKMVWDSVKDIPYKVKPDKKNVENIINFANNEGFACDCLFGRVQRVAVPIKLNGQSIASVASGWYSETQDMEKNKNVAEQISKIVQKIESKI